MSLPIGSGGEVGGRLPKAKGRWGHCIIHTVSGADRLVRRIASKAYSATSADSGTSSILLTSVSLVHRRCLPISLGSLPDRNGDRAIGKLSRRNELLNAFNFLVRSRWLELLYEKILYSGQHICCSSSSEFLQSGRDTRRKFLGYIKILHISKWTEKIQPFGVLDIIFPIQWRR